MQKGDCWSHPMALDLQVSLFLNMHVDIEIDIAVHVHVHTCSHVLTLSAEKVQKNRDPGNHEWVEPPFTNESAEAQSGSRPHS